MRSSGRRRRATRRRALRRGGATVARRRRAVRVRAGSALSVGDTGVVSGGLGSGASAPSFPSMLVQARERSRSRDRDGV